MVSETTVLILHIVQFTCASLSILLGIRIAYVLSANPIGEFTAELVYLRYRELRTTAWFILIVLLAEIGQALLPFLERRSYVAVIDGLNVFVNTLQVAILLIVATMVLLVVNRYTHRALDRRIRESMETLAYLEGQRRRRRSVERGEWEREAADEE